MWEVLGGHREKGTGKGKETWRPTANHKAEFRESCKRVGDRIVEKGKGNEGQGL